MPGVLPSMHARALLAPPAAVGQPTASRLEHSARLRRRHTPHTSHGAARRQEGLESSRQSRGAPLGAGQHGRDSATRWAPTAALPRPAAACLPCAACPPPGRRCRSTRLCSVRWADRCMSDFHGYQQRANAQLNARMGNLGQGHHSSSCQPAVLLGAWQSAGRVRRRWQKLASPLSIFFADVVKAICSHR